MDPTHTDTGGARDYAALLLGQGAWCAPCADGDCLRVPVTGLADPVEQWGLRPSRLLCAGLHMLLQGKSRGSGPCCSLPIQPPSSLEVSGAEGCSIPSAFQELTTNVTSMNNIPTEANHDGQLSINTSIPKSVKESVVISIITLMNRKGSTNSEQKLSSEAIFYISV